MMGVLKRLTKRTLFGLRLTGRDTFDRTSIESKGDRGDDDDARMGFFGALGWLLLVIGSHLPLVGRYIRRMRKRREHETEPFGAAAEVKKREELRKALVDIRKAKFYTYEGLVSLAQDHYAREHLRLIDEAKNPNLSPEKQRDLRKQARERGNDVRVLKKWAIDEQLSKELRLLGETDDTEKYVKVPKGKRLRLMHEFMDQSGLIKSPVPIKWLVDQPDIVQSLVYKAAGSGDMLYHALRIAMGQDDPKAAFKSDDDKNASQPFAGAVYMSFIFDSPYFKRGVFVVRNGDQRGPVEVEYFEGWRNHLSGGQGYGRLTQRYEDYYRGYLLDQGYDSYVFLFGPQDPSLKFNDPYNALLAFRGLDKILEKWGDTWDPRETDIADFLRSLDIDAVTDLMELFVRNSEDVAREAAASGAYDDDGGKVKLVADYTGRATMDALIDDPLLKGVPMVAETKERKRDFRAEAEGLRRSLWQLFEVDGKTAPQVGQNRRIRTLYLEGANRSALTPHALRGTVQSFDNTSKSEMLLERTIMYRLGLATTNPVDLAKVTVVARNRSDRFDMRQYFNPDYPGQAEAVRSALAEFEPAYGEIFLALGYDITISGEERKAFRLNPVVNNTVSDEEDMEFVIE